MLTSLITGLFALGGVALGVLLEPVKAVAASRVKRRQDRTELCSSFIRTAAAMRSHVLALNVRHRMKEIGGIEVDGSEVRNIEEQYFAHRTELRQQLLLLQLHGPDELARQAGIVRNADRALRDVRFALDDDNKFDRHVMPNAVKTAAQAFEAEIEVFAILGRKLI